MPDDHKPSDDDWRIPDVLGKRIVPFLPPRKPHPRGCHRPRVDDRKAMEAIFCVLRTGCQWNALNATGLCSSSSAHRRFQEWIEADVFVALWEQGRVDYEAVQGINWEWLAMDGAIHAPSPAWGEKGGQASHGPRQERHHAPPAHRRQGRASRARRGGSAATLLMRCF